MSDNQRNLTDKDVDAELKQIMEESSMLEQENFLPDEGGQFE